MLFHKNTKTIKDKNIAIAVPGGGLTMGVVGVWMMGVNKRTEIKTWISHLAEVIKSCACIFWINCSIGRQIAPLKKQFLIASALQWHHNDHDGVSNHQPRGCLLNRLFRCRSKKTSKLHVTGLCVGNSPGPVNSPHKGPVTRKMFPFDDVIMVSILRNCHK